MTHQGLTLRGSARYNCEMKRQEAKKSFKNNTKNPKVVQGKKLSKSSRKSSRVALKSAPKKERSSEKDKNFSKKGNSKSTIKSRKALGDTPRFQEDPEVTSCLGCSKKLTKSEKAFFVEEDIGRVFCSEDCISGYFAPEIKKLEKEYFKLLPFNDLTSSERDDLAHLRWLTLREPDEVWRQKTFEGDYRFTLISEFQPENKKVWCVCICLFLRGEPSFLYLAFPTKNENLANAYRRGERYQWQKKETSMEAGPNDRMDGLADPWTENETMMAQRKEERTKGDIPVSDFGLYQNCLEETLEAPDEVWSMELKNSGALRLYHFLRHYPDETPGLWYVVIAKETEDDDDQIEIMDSFPTRDSELVQQFRKGHQEVGNMEKSAPKRMVH